MEEILQVTTNLRDRFGKTAFIVSTSSIHTCFRGVRLFWRVVRFCELSGWSELQSVTFLSR